MTSKTSNTTGPATYEIIKSTKRDITGIDVDGKKMMFGKDGAFRVNDPGIARSIDEKYGLEGGTREVTISKLPVREEGHRYSFSVPRTCEAKGCFAKPVTGDYCEEHGRAKTSRDHRRKSR